MYVWNIKIHNSEKKNENVVPFENGGQITDFWFASSILAKIRKKKTKKKKTKQKNKTKKKKTLSLKWNEIWLNVREHEYIYITEITFEKKNIPF